MRRPSTDWFQVPSIQLKAVIAQVAEVGLGACGFAGHCGHSLKTRELLNCVFYWGRSSVHILGCTTPAQVLRTAAR